MLPTKFVVQPSESLKCPICRELFEDPVISTQCGHTFCRNCIRNGVSLTGNSGTKCPLDGTILQRFHLVSNLAVKGQIEDLQIYCRHGLTRTDSEEDFEIDLTGCQERISFGKRIEHEEACGFALVPCPNSSNQCGKFRRKALDDHLKDCAQYRCLYSVKGCEHVGTKLNVDEHCNTCQYKNSADPPKCQALHSGSSEELRSSVQVLSERVSWLENNQDALMTQVEQCNSSISRLSETVEDLSFQVEQLTVILKRSSLYREMSVTSIPDTINSSQSTSPDETGQLSYSYGHKSRLKPSNMVSSTHHDAWSIPCVFKCIGTLRGHRGSIWSLVSRGHRLFSAGGDQVIKVWNMENVRLAKCTEVLEGHSNDIHAMCIGGGKLYSVASDQSIISWNLENLTLHKRVEHAHDNIICAIVYNGKFLFTSSHSCIKVWEASTLQEVHKVPDLHHWVRALALDVKRVSLKELRWCDRLCHLLCVVFIMGTSGVTVNHDCYQYFFMISTGTYNQNIHVYDVNTYQYVKALVGHIGTVTSLVPATTGKLLFSASYDTTVQVWNLDTMLPMQTLSRHEGSVNCVVIHKDLLLSGSEDMEIKVFKYFKAE
ncbi:unnamed protein product [Porites evermanni]|uniref:TNF receptor-associated factor 7 n=1 Tax=Porites evermanni TaxID=104178 RepID=A0ABN8PUG1_9CNID|nr:unnamed protein product [Porites evermanni]